MIEINLNRAYLIDKILGEKIEMPINEAYIYVNDEKVDVSDCIHDDGTYLSLYDVKHKIEQDLPWEIELVSDNINVKTTFEEWQAE